MSPDPHAADASRREFAAALAALLLAAPASAAADRPVTLAEALAALVKDRFGTVLTDEQQRLLVEGLGRARIRGDFLKSAAVTNADEPAYVFRADPEA